MNFQALTGVDLQGLAQINPFLGDDTGIDSGLTPNPIKSG